MKKDPVIVYYVSSHGFGHAARTCDVLQELVKMLPYAELHIVTGIPGNFFFSRVSGLNAVIHSRVLDVGMIQKDSIQVDLQRTLKELTRLYACCPESIAGEVAFLKSIHADLVVADIVPAAIEAADQAALPGVVVANFTWDWIYENQADASISKHPIVDLMRSQYAKAELLVELPFACPMNVFTHRVSVGLLAKAGGCRRDLISLAAGADVHKRWVLLAFRQLDLKKRALDRMMKNSEVEWFSVEPLSWPESTVHMLNRRDFTFPDILASVDVAVSKPGFGIVSECLANQVPLVYADRADFAEYEYLEAGIRRYLRNAFIPQEDLYAGMVDHALNEAVTSRPPKEKLSAEGAAETVQQLLSFISR